MEEYNEQLKIYQEQVDAYQKGSGNYTQERQKAYEEYAEELRIWQEEQQRQLEQLEQVK